MRRIREISEASATFKKQTGSSQFASLRFTMGPPSSIGLIEIGTSGLCVDQSRFTGSDVAFFVLSFSSGIAQACQELTLDGIKINISLIKLHDIDSQDRAFFLAGLTFIETLRLKSDNIESTPFPLGHGVLTPFIAHHRNLHMKIEKAQPRLTEDDKEQYWPMALPAKLVRQEYNQWPSLIELEQLIELVDKPQHSLVDAVISLSKDEDTGTSWSGAASAQTCITPTYHRQLDLSGLHTHYQTTATS